MGHKQFKANSIAPDVTPHHLASHLGLFCLLNPYLTNAFAHYYHLDESTFILGDIRSDFKFLFTFSLNFLLANTIAPDGTPHLGLFYFLCPIKGSPGLNELKMK